MSFRYFRRSQRARERMGGFPSSLGGTVKAVFFDETFDVDWDNVLPEIPEPAFLIVGQDETFDSDWWDT